MYRFFAVPQCSFPTQYSMYPLATWHEQHGTGSPWESSPHYMPSCISIHWNKGYHYTWNNWEKFMSLLRNLSRRNSPIMHRRKFLLFSLSLSISQRHGGCFPITFLILLTQTSSSSQLCLMCSFLFIPSRYILLAFISNVMPVSVQINPVRLFFLSVFHWFITIILHEKTQDPKGHSQYPVYGVDNKQGEYVNIKMVILISFCTCIFR